MAPGPQGGARRLRVLLGVAVVLAGTLGGCSLLLDLDPMNGHPCDDAGACLPGWTCNAKDICVPAPGGGPTDAGTCPAGQIQDPDGGTCVFDCANLACPAGDTCDPSQGCITATSGLGMTCTADSQCVGASPACTAGTATCRCLAASAGVAICVAVPNDPTDCTVCGDAACVKPALAPTGTAGGATVPQAICVPPGFQLCGGPGDCVNGVQPVACGLDFFFDTSGATPPPGGHFSACTAPVPSSGVDLGQPCQGGGDCATGLCLPAGKGQARCSAPCAAASDCATGMATCVQAWVKLTDPHGGVVPATDTVCGVGGTLGTACNPTAQPDTWPCATDAPLCVTDGRTSATVCTRDCATASDCSSATTCRAPSTGSATVCLSP